MDSYKTELAEKKAGFNAEFDYYAGIAKTYNDLQSNAASIAKIDDALPQGPVLGKLIYYLQKSAGENGIIIRSLFLSKSSSATSTAGTGNTVKDITFSMDLLGDYSSLGKYLVSLEKSSRLVEVNSISFSGSSQSQTGPNQSQFQMQQTFDFSLQLTTHSY